MAWEHKFVEIDGLRTHYVQAGEGRPLILVHGLGASFIIWSYNIDVFANNYTVYALDLPGHGDSDKPQALEYDAISGAHFLYHFMNKLDIPQAALIGNSAGGLVAANCGLFYPKRVAKLVLVDSAGLGREIPWFFRFASLPIIGELLETPNVRNAKNLVKSIFYQPRPLGDGVVRELMRVRNLPGAKKAVLKGIRSSINIMGFRKEQQVLHNLRSLNIPLLILWGREDRIIPLAHAYHAAKILPNARVHVISYCGHWPQMEKWEEFNQVTLQFLERVL